MTLPPLLPRRAAADIGVRRGDAVDATTRRDAALIVDAVRTGGASAVRSFATRFGERDADETLLLERPALDDARARLDASDLGVLERTAERIADFARAQRDAIRPLDLAIPGGRAGHDLVPVTSAGCYAPGGRYPLPSSVLMTVVPARVAGCARIIVATPAPSDIMLAAAAIAGADRVLAVGGAHAIGALAYGIDDLDPVDLIVGPGNRWVTAAKALVHGVVGIDMLAGPSELLIIADDSADPDTVAADLLAQAEHDPDAVPVLVTTHESLLDDVDDRLRSQLETLPARDTARAALDNGAAVVASDIPEAVTLSDRFAPEHLQLHVRDARGVAARCRHAGGVFIGSRSAEVFGDYGFGPNHTLPTGGTARCRAGLSVLDFLRPRTWMRLAEDGDASARADAARLAELEGLIGHQRAALARHA